MSEVPVYGGAPPPHNISIVSSRWIIVAENRGKAPARFVLDVFDAEPQSSNLIAVGVSQQDDPAHLLRIAVDEMTDPGKAVRIEQELAFEPESNDKGYKLWFRMPAELRGKFLLHELTVNGQSMMKTVGII